MGNISVEQKLCMLNQLRTRYDKDMTDLMRREEILYGKTSSVSNMLRTSDYSVENEPGSNSIPVRSTFRLRLLMAAILAVLLILSDRRGQAYFGVSTSQIYTLIERDYLTQIEEILNQS